MRKTIINAVGIALVLIVLFYGIGNYLTENFEMYQNGFFPEGVHEDYMNKLMGLSGWVRNDTIFPIKIEQITPIGGHGIKYYTTIISSWGVSASTPDELSKFQLLEGKKLGPHSDVELGIFFQFSEEYAINPVGYEIRYSVLGVKLTKYMIRSE